MSYFPDLAKESMAASGEHVRAIGWLHPDHPYSRGDVSAEFVARLKQFIAQKADCAEALWFGAFMGIHTCEFCDKAHGVANFGVPFDDQLFVAPEMITHYIEQHRYCPPSEFVTAVMNCPLPSTDEYQVLAEPFWHLHRKAMQQAIEKADREFAANKGIDWRTVRDDV